MATLAAAFGSSHSVMLSSTLDDWLHGFSESDLRMPYFDRGGRRISYHELLANAPANACDYITKDRIASELIEAILKVVSR